MMQKCRCWTGWTALLVALALVTGAVGAQGPAGPEAPIITPISWTDLLDDPTGLSWLEGTLLNEGQVNLSQMEVLSEDVGGIWSLTEGPDGKFYMGTDDARLWSYDPATGATTDLGAPVPDECFT